MMGVGVHGDRLRVAFYLESPEMGGAEVFLRSLLSALDPGIDPLLLAVDEPIASQVAASRPDMETVVVPPVRSRSDLRALRSHTRALRAFDAHVVHVNQRQLWSGQYGLLAARLARVPAIGVVHGVFPHASESQRRLAIALARGVARFVGVSQFAAAAIQQLLKVPEHRVATIPNGVPSADAAGFPAPQERDPRLVAVVGRLAPEKGVDVLIDAVARTPDLRLDVVGDGPDLGRLEKQVLACGLSGRVRFLGWCSDPWSLRPSPAALVVPSRRDNAPLVILEAMQRGVPVVASRVGEIGELVDEHTGALVPPGDAGALAAALKALLDQPAELARLGCGAAERARSEFGLELMAERYGRLYHEVALRSASAQPVEADGSARADERPSRPV